MLDEIRRNAAGSLSRHLQQIHTDSSEVQRTLVPQQGKPIQTTFLILEDLPDPEVVRGLISQGIQTAVKAAKSVTQDHC